MEQPVVTIVVVPRERFSMSLEALDSLRANTTVPYRLIYLAAGAPPALLAELKSRSRAWEFELVEVPHYLAPNESRNLGWQRVKTPFTVFVENDVVMTPGWLDALLDCAQSTGAGIVGPQIRLGRLEEGIFHMGPGRLSHPSTADGVVEVKDMSLHNRPLADLPPLSRQPCDYCEFHVLLVRTELYQALGPLDQGLLSLHEYIDLAKVARQAGYSVYFEPASIICYLNGPPQNCHDIGFFLYRWCDTWNLASHDRYREKWGIVSQRNEQQADADIILKFARGHRRMAAKAHLDLTDISHFTLVDQVRFVLGLLMSVDLEWFDVRWGTEERRGVSVDEIMREILPVLDGPLQLRPHSQTMSLHYRSPLDPGEAENALIACRRPDGTWCGWLAERGSQTPSPWLGVPLPGELRSAHPCRVTSDILAPAGGR